MSAKEFEEEYNKEFEEDLHIDEMQKTNKARTFEEAAGGRIVICGANAYEQKYYFNPVFKQIPESIKKELNIISVIFNQ